MHDGHMGRKKLGDVGKRIGLVRWSYEGRAKAWLPGIVVGLVVKRASGIWHLDSYTQPHALNVSDRTMHQPYRTPPTAEVLAPRDAANNRDGESELDRAHALVGAVAQF